MMRIEDLLVASVPGHSLKREPGTKHSNFEGVKTSKNALHYGTPSIIVHLLAQPLVEQLLLLIYVRILTVTQRGAN